MLPNAPFNLLFPLSVLYSRAIHIYEYIYALFKSFYYTSYLLFPSPPIRGFHVSCRQQTINPHVLPSLLNTPTHIYISYLRFSWLFSPHNYPPIIILHIASWLFNSSLLSYLNFSSSSLTCMHTHTCIHKYKNSMYLIIK